MDSFSRSVVNGWGTSDSGHVWTDAGYEAGAIDVNGTRGTFNIVSVGNSCGAVTDMATKHLTGMLKWTYSDVPTGNLNRIIVSVRADSILPPSSFITFVVENNNGGEIRLFSNFGPDVAFSIGGYVHPEQWYLKFEIIGDAGRMKVWDVAESEPSNWQYIAGGIPIGPDAHTHVMISGSRFSTNIVEMTIDDLDLIPVTHFYGSPLAHAGRGAAG